MAPLLGVRVNPKFNGSCRPDIKVGRETGIWPIWR